MKRIIVIILALFCFFMLQAQWKTALNKKEHTVDQIYQTPNPYVYVDGDYNINVNYGEYDLATLSQSLIARMPVSLSLTDKANIDTLIRSLVNKGYWNRIDDLWVFTMKDSANALIDWKRSKGNLIAKKSVTFDSYKGFYGNSTDSSYLETNIIPYFDCYNYKKNNGSIGTYMNSNITEDHKYLFGTSDAPNDSGNTGNFNRTLAIQSKVNSGAGSSTDIQVEIWHKHDGFLLTNRSDSTSEQVYFDGYLQKSVSGTNYATGNNMATTSFHILNNGATNGNNSDNRVAFAFVAGSFSSEEVYDLNNIFYKNIKSNQAYFYNWNNDTVLVQKFEGIGYDHFGYFVGTGIYNPDYTTIVLDGTESMYIEGVASNINVSTQKVGDTVNVQFMIQISDVTPTTPNNIMWGSFYPSGSTQFLLRLNTNGKLILYNGGTTANGTTILSDNTTYFIWINYVKGSGSDGISKCWISGTSTKPDTAEISITNGTATSQVHFYQLYGTDVSAIYDNLIITR